MSSDVIDTIPAMLLFVRNQGLSPYFWMISPDIMFDSEFHDTLFHLPVYRFNCPYVNRSRGILLVCNKGDYSLYSAVDSDRPDRVEIWHYDQITKTTFAYEGVSI